MTEGLAGQVPLPDSLSLCTLDPGHDLASQQPPLVCVLMNERQLESALGAHNGVRKALYTVSIVHLLI